MKFMLDHETFELEPDNVRHALSAQRPEPIQQYAVDIDGRLFPVKQALEVALGVSRTRFTSQTARRHLARLGFAISGTSSASTDLIRASEPKPQPSSSARAWPWEGAVQAVFASMLVDAGWRILSTADTATKARGVDVVAEKKDRRVAAEVKGYPSKGYADPRRANETKRTQPSNQAGHWFSQAIVKSMMAVDESPGSEAVAVFPNFSRYDDLAARTRTARTNAAIHVVLLEPDGSYRSDTWTA